MRERIGWGGLKKKTFKFPFANILSKPQPNDCTARLRRLVMSNKNVQAILIYTICDEVLKIFNIKNDPQSIMTQAEVMTFCILAAKLHTGNHALACWTCRVAGYFPKILSLSRLKKTNH